MDHHLEQRLDAWIASHREELIAAIAGAVAIKSVAQPEPDAPFPLQRSSAAILQYMMELSASYGFPAENHEYYCATALCAGTDRAHSIGIFGHVDVVPEGDNWTCDPYCCVEQDGYLYGRGTLDDKGATIAAVFALRFLQESGYALRSDVLLYFGASEECGMLDIEYYGAHHDFPDFSLVPDASFPGCYGEKGILELEVCRPLTSGNLLDIYAGKATNIIPDQAWAEISGYTAEELRAIVTDADCQMEDTGRGVRLTVAGVGGHAAFPEGTRNAISMLLELLERYKLLCGDAAEAVAFLRQTCSDWYGAGLNIAYDDAQSGRTTHVCSMLRLTDGMLSAAYNIRYAVTQPRQPLVQNLTQLFQTSGWTLSQCDDNPPAYLPLEHPIVRELVCLAQNVLHDDHPPYTMGGGTYARKIPNALAYGPHIQGEVQPGGPGRGSGHQPDECMSIANLLNAVKVYALALLRIDHLLYNGDSQLEESTNYSSNVLS